MTRSVSQEEYRQHDLAFQVARQQEVQAQMQLDLLKAGAWKYDIDVAQAAVDAAKAQAQQTETDIQRSLVRRRWTALFCRSTSTPASTSGRRRAKR